MIAGAIAFELFLLVFVRATLVVVVAGAAVKLVRRSAATRSAIWGGAAVCLLVVPGLAALLPSRSISLGAVSEIVPALERVERAIGASAAALSPTNAARVDAGSPAANPLAVPVDVFVAVFVAVWAVGVAAFSTRLLLAVLTSRRLVAAVCARPVDERIQSTLIAVCRAAGLARVPRIGASDAMVGPATSGVLRPCILLPADAPEWDANRLEAVLRHEVAHVARRDWVTHLALEVACAFYWLNPLVWRAAAHARVELEQAADDFVLEGPIAPDVYAALLLDAARAARTPPLPSHAGTIAMTAPPLKQRVAAILDGRTRSRTLRAGNAVAAIVSVALSPAVATISFAAPMKLVARETDVAAIEAAAEPGTPRPFGAPNDSLMRVLYYSDVRSDRLVAARAITRRASDDSHARLIERLADTCRADRWRAARALRELADVRTVRPLIATMLSDGDEAVRGMAANAVAALPVSHSAPALRRALTGANGPAFGRAGRALDTLGDTPPHSALLAVLRDVRDHSAQ